mmetsp:Transcript_987/g.1078  ORF Transcript_987/g.1078 Transcript_987/m.1078 type:complete len:548 (+) Transcript_987:266-1909(+)
MIDITPIIEAMKATHSSRINQSLSWRLHQLKTMQTMLTQHEDEFCDALYQDLHKSHNESMYCEIIHVQNEISKLKKNLKEWMKPVQVSSPAALAPSVCEIRSVPLSSPGVLIIAPFNYPVSLSLVPAIGALAGGNPVVLKPSEMCINVSKLFAKLVPKYFDKGAFQVVEGGVPETTELMKQSWGLCFFTGSERVGRVIQMSAAKTLTPTILELGGKSPTVISHDCPDNMNVVSNRIAYGKFMNCGQSCISPDYVLCHQSKVQDFCEAFQSSVEKFFTKNPKDAEMTRVVSEGHTHRLIDMIKEIEEVEHKKDDKETEDRQRNVIVFGGSASCSVKDKYVTPTLILNPSVDSRVMKEEIFGPILTVLSYDTDDEAISIINDMKGTPLTCYVFTKSQKTYEKYVSNCPAGAFSRNETLLHYVVGDFPFGGKGTSGIGHYHGKYSFDTFTHKLSSLSRPCYKAVELDMRYYPKGMKAKMLLSALRYAPDIPSMRCIRNLFFYVVLIATLVMVYVVLLSGSQNFSFPDMIEMTALSRLFRFLNNEEVNKVR